MIVNAHPAPCATYSFLLRDPVSGWLGSAVASKYLAVGGAVSHPWPGAGVVHGQFWCSHDIAHAILRGLTAGKEPQAALEAALVKDSLPHKRQILVMDMQGRTAVHTGADATPVHAAVARQDFVAAGNTLANAEVIDAIERSAEATRREPLLLRLIRGLEAAESKGGDHRGKQSAAVRVLQPADRSWNDDILDLRVDDHPDPISELHRLHQLSLKK